jgi:hypothetical protein
MKRFWGHIRAASVVACVGGLVLSSCAHDDSSLYVVQIVAPPRPDPVQGCLYAAPSAQVPGLFGGVLDVGLSSTYSPVVMLGNQLNARSDQLNVRTETNRINIRGAIVRVTDSQGNQLSSFTSLSEATIEPQTGSTPGLGQASITLVDPGTAAGLAQSLTNRSARKTIVAYFRVYGNTLGGTYVESSEFQHVVETCNGCLVSFPPDAVDPAKPTPNCAAGIGTAGANTLATPCQLGQNQIVDCRLCVNSLDVCDPQKFK